MKSVIVASALVSLAAAQSNPLIPSGASSGCTSYLTSMNTDTTLAPCISPLISATAAFAPGTNSTASASAIQSALNSMCASTSQCDVSAVRKALASFYAACTPELTSARNADVVKTYDVLYALYPLSQAVCAKDDSGKYCATNIPSSSSSASNATGAKNLAVHAASSISQYLTVTPGTTKRAATQVALQPNATTYASSNLLFLALQPTLDTSALCTACTRQVLSSYISFESATPYAPGLSNSALLTGQSALYSAVQSKCGQSFLSGAVQAAGGIGSGVAGQSGGAPAGVVLSGGVAALVGAVSALLAL